MAGPVATTYVDVKPLMAGFQTSLTAGLNQATSTISGKLSTLGKQMLVGFGAAFAGPAILGFFSDTITAASNLEESINKVDVVFGDNAAAIKSWAEGAAENLGLSEQAALEATGTFGNLFDSMGIGSGATKEMSTGLVQLAADLASFNNTSIDDAIQALRSGLVGEIEPLRRFGVNINQATLETEALSQGLIKQGEDLDAAGKAQAAYSLILEQTTNAQGDFARTSDSAANQQKIFAAQFEDFKSELGQGILPAFTQLVSVSSDLLGALQPLLQFLPQAITLFGSWFAITKVIPGVLNLMGGGIANVAAQLPVMTGAMDKAFSATGKLQAGVRALSGALTVGLAAALIYIPQLLDSLSVNLNKVAKETGLSRNFIGQLEEQMASITDFESSDEIGGFKGFITALNGTKDNVRGLAEELAPLHQALQDLGLSAFESEGFLKQFFEGFTSPTQENIDAVTNRISNTIDSVSAWMQNLGKGKTSMDVFTTNMERIGFSTQHTSAIARAALDRYGKSLDKNGNVVRRWGNLSSGELKEFRSSVQQTFTSSFTDVNAFNRKWEFTSRQFGRLTEQMARKSRVLERDLDKFSDMKVPDQFSMWLQQQGPDAVHAYVNANKEGRQSIEADWRIINQSTRGVNRTVVDLTTDVEDLNGKKAEVDVVVNYSWKGIDPRSLPGLDR